MRERRDEAGAAAHEWSLRLMTPADLPELLDGQHRGAVLGLADVFDQTLHPFPLEEIRERWMTELQDPSIAAYVVTAADGSVLGFAVRREDELLHFGTTPETWGSGLAGWLHDALLGTFPAGTRRLHLWVFAGNRRARRLYEKLGWTATGGQRHTSYPPHPLLLEYEIQRAAAARPGASPTVSGAGYRRAIR